MDLLELDYIDVARPYIKELEAYEKNQSATLNNCVKVACALLLFSVIYFQGITMFQILGTVLLPGIYYFLFDVYNPAPLASNFEHSKDVDFYEATEFHMIGEKVKTQ